MQRKQLRGIALGGALALALAGTAGASGGHEMKRMGKPGVAMDGLCTVCLAKGKVVKGSPRFVTEYKGKLYFFASFASQKAFLNDPEKVLAGAAKKYEDLKGKMGEMKQHMEMEMKGSGMHQGSGMKGSY